MNKNTDLKFQVEMALEEVLNSDSEFSYIDEMIGEVLYYVERTEYTETGMNDKPTNRLKGEKAIVAEAKRQIMKNKDAIARIWEFQK